MYLLQLVLEPSAVTMEPSSDARCLPAPPYPWPTARTIPMLNAEVVTTRGYAANYSFFHMSSATSDPNATKEANAS